MKSKIIFYLRSALNQLIEDQQLPPEILDNDIILDRPKLRQHGDFSCNIAMQIAKLAKQPPRNIAQLIVDHIAANKIIKTVEIAGPGFINIHLSTESQYAVIKEILDQGQAFGQSRIGEGQRIQVEFVSANPTGPLHVGHGRGAAYGDTLARLLKTVGFQVHLEYYVNDAGRQMHILALSVWIRYLQANGIDIIFPQGAYQGDYVLDLGQELKTLEGGRFVPASPGLNALIECLNSERYTPDEHLDRLIEHAKNLLGTVHYQLVFDLGLSRILSDIREDLEDFGINYDQWFSERSLEEQGLIQHYIEQLREAGQVYERDGALWFRSTLYGDEKDRVVQRENGQTTYFASDIAYHLDKFSRGFETVIDIWGADHHGYVPRIKAALSAFQMDPERLKVLLVQFAILYRGKEKVQMSTRSGSFVTLRALRDEVGTDAARFFYVMRSASQHLDFDLELAKSQSSDNPVYYIQYAHARIQSVFRQLEERGLVHDHQLGNTELHTLNSEHEISLTRDLARYPELVEAAACTYEPHLIAQYLKELAQRFHAWYNAEQFIVEDEKIRNARLNLCAATGIIIRNGLSILGVSSPDSM